MEHKVFCDTPMLKMRRLNDLIGNAKLFSAGCNRLVVRCQRKWDGRQNATTFRPESKDDLCKTDAKALVNKK